MDVIDKPLYLVAVIRPRPDRVAEAEQELRALMAGTRAEPGCIYMELVVDEGDDATWYMFEKFRSRAEWEIHMRTDHVQLGNANLAGMLREPTELRFYTEK